MNIKSNGKSRMKPLIAALLLTALSTQAQTYTNLHAFSTYGFDTANDSGTNSDGYDLYGGLVLSGNVLYGAAFDGGTNGNGTVYAVNADGSDFRVLHTFAAPYVTYGTTNSEGAFPHDTLALGDNVLFGTTTEGGTNGYGTVFRVNTDGTGFQCLHSFSLGNDGINPTAGLLLAGDTLYGAAAYGGTGLGAGAVFKLSTNGTGYKLLHSFSGGSNDGGFPNGGLLLADGILYGASSSGGALARGAVFALSTNGTGNGSGYTNLYVFTGTNSPYAITTNNNGETPYCGLALSGNTLYGTTVYGGTNSNGTIFSIETNGTGFSNMYVFSATTNSYDPTNLDGAHPIGPLLLSGNTLYGTASDGGTNSQGTVFSINTDGTGFTNLYSFIPILVISGGNFYNYGGDGPNAGVILSSNTLYGTTFAGGTVDGNVFALILSSSAPSTAPIPVTNQVSGNTLLLGWNNATFSLQTALSIGGPFTNVPGAISPYIVVMTNSQQYFRLQAN
jgi:uncharacterized repeat protein (TIGR03803 family)